MDFSSMARIGADAASLAATAIAVQVTRSPMIDALVNAVSSGRVNNQTLSSHLLDGIMRFIGDHVPVLAKLDDDEGRLLRNAILISTSPDQAIVQRAADGIIADAVTAPSQAILSTANQAIKHVLGDLPVAQVIQAQIASKVSGFRDNVESRLKAHMAVGGNELASQKMLKAVVDKHGWVAIDKLTTTLVSTATNGNALADKAAHFGYGLVKHALHYSVVRNPLYATNDASALQMGGTLFSTVAAMAKVEGFTGEAAAGSIDLLAGSLSHLSPALQKTLNAVVDLAKPALESARATRAQLSVFANSVVNVETAIWDTPKIKMKPQAAIEAIRASAKALQSLLDAMHDTIEKSSAALTQGAIAMEGLQRSPAADKLRETSEVLAAAAQAVKDIRDTPSLTLMHASLTAFRNTSWYPQLISDLDNATPGTGQSLERMLSGSLRFITVADQGSRVLSGLAAAAGSVNQSVKAVANAILPGQINVAAPLSLVTTHVSQTGWNLLSGMMNAVGSTASALHEYSGLGEVPE